MLALTLNSGYRDYWWLPKWVLDHGRPRAPRGQKTYDAGPVTLTFASPYNALPVDCGRGLNPRIAAVEALQLIGAQSDPDLTNWASPNFREFSESDGSFHGAYGRRIGGQLEHAVGKLKTDLVTRQAVITLWDPLLDNQPMKHDYPCTVALNLAVVDGRVELRTLMRSNDVWLGLPYDIFQFTQLQLTVANALDLPAGPYTHTTWSLHLYDRHVDRLEGMHAPGSDVHPEQPAGMPAPQHAVMYAMMRARRLMNRNLHSVWGEPGTLDLSFNEWWYYEQLKGWYRDAGVVG